MADKSHQVNGVDHVFCSAISREQSTCNCLSTLLWEDVIEHESNPSRPPKSPPDASLSGVSLAPGIFVDAQAIRIRFVRSSGPGGQNVNKRSTKAQLRIHIDEIPLPNRARIRLLRLARGAINDKGELLLSADDTRSQSRNKQACMDRLREIIMRSMIEPKQRKATKPTKGSIRRRLENKKQRAQRKEQRKPPQHP